MIWWRRCGVDEIKGDVNTAGGSSRLAKLGVPAGRSVQFSDALGDDRTLMLIKSVFTRG